MTFDPRDPPFCSKCGEDILTPPNVVAGDRTNPLCDKCFMERIDPKHEPWLYDHYEQAYPADVVYCSCCGKALEYDPHVVDRGPNAQPHEFCRLCYEEWLDAREADARRIE